MAGKSVLHLPALEGKVAKNACQGALDKWCDQHKAEARRDPLRFHAVVAPRLLADLDATIIPENDFLAQRLAEGKREFLAPYLDTMPQDCARIWYRRRQQQRALIVEHARHEFADDPPPELTPTEIEGANRTPAETRTAHRKEYRLAQRRKRASKWSPTP
jgi:hypothetical protein